MNNRINELQREIEFERRRMDNCSHVFGEASYDPETVTEGYGSRLVTMGSDAWSEYAGYRDVEKPRWSKTCTECGFTKYTYKQKPVVSSYEPDFN